MQNIKTTGKCFWEGKRVHLRPFKSEDVDMIRAEKDSESIRIYEPGIHPDASIHWDEVLFGLTREEFEESEG